MQVNYPKQHGEVVKGTLWSLGKLVDVVPADMRNKLGTKILLIKDMALTLKKTVAVFKNKSIVIKEMVQII